MLCLYVILAWLAGGIVSVCILRRVLAFTGRLDEDAIVGILLFWPACLVFIGAVYALCVFTRLVNKGE